MSETIGAQQDRLSSAVSEPGSDTGQIDQTVDIPATVRSAGPELTGQIAALVEPGMLTKPGTIGPGEATAVSHMNAMPSQLAPDETTMVAPGGSAAAATGFTPQPGQGAAQPFGEGGVAPPPTPERYELVENFAKGGMGRIWRAVDSRINRVIAYKELLVNASQNPTAVEQFYEESQITGQLEHPGIVPIYDLGTRPDGSPFFAMKLIEGQTFRDTIGDFHEVPDTSDEKPLAFARLLRNFIDICNAIAFAHDRGVIHRDLKPLNIMVGSFGETLVLDWGLAQILDNLGLPDEGGTNIGINAIPADGSHADVTLERPDQNPSGVAATAGNAAPSVAAATPVNPSDGTMVNEIEMTMPGSIDTGQAAESFSADVTQDVPLSAGPSSLQTPADSVDMSGQTMDVPAGANMTGVPQPSASGFAASSPSVMGSQQYTAHPSMPSKTRVRTTRGTSRREEDGSLVGTPAFMAPEQAAGMVSEVDARSDIFALGGILYQIITGVQPYQGKSALSVLKLARDAQYRPPREIKNSAPKPLEAICLKAMAKEKNERYQSALALAADVEAWLADQPVSAWVEPWHLRARRWARKHRTLVTSCAVGLVMLVAGLVAWGTVEGRRVAALHHQAEQKHVQAGTAFGAGELDQARSLLSEAMGLLVDQPDSELALDVGQLQTDVVQAIDSRDERRAAAANLAKFDERADLARFYGSLFMGDDIDEDCRQAQKAAAEALVLRDAMSAADAETTKQTAFEMLLLIADCETILARNADQAGKKAAAATSLAHIDRAKKLGIESRALLLREAEYCERLEDETRREAARDLASQTDPSSALDFFLLAEMSRKSGDFDKAFANYHAALRSNPDHFLSLNFLGQCYLDAGRADAAVVSYTSCIARRPDYAASYLSRAMAYARLGEFGPAEEDLSRVDQLRPQWMECALIRGLVQFQQNHHAEALAAFREAASIRPDRIEPTINIAEVLRVQGELDEALTAAHQAAEKVPDSAKLHRLLGRIFVDRKSTAEAVTAFTKASALERNKTDIAHCLKEVGKIHGAAGQHAEALAAFTQSLANHPDDADVIRMQGEVLLKLNQFAEAVDAFSEFLKRSGPQADIYRARGLARARLGQKREALADYTRALELEPDTANMLTRRGWLLLLDPKPLALEDFENAVRLNPKNSDSYAGRGFAKAQMGDHRGAAADADQALRLASPQVQQQGAGAWPLLFNVATIYAAAAGQVEGDAELDETQKAAQFEAYAGMTVKLLAVTLNTATRQYQPMVIQTIKGDAAFAPLADHKPFRQLLGEE